MVVILGLQHRVMKFVNIKTHDFHTNNKFGKYTKH